MYVKFVFIWLSIFLDEFYLIRNKFIVFCEFDICVVIWIENN